MRAALSVCLLCVAVGCKGVSLRNPVVCDRPGEPSCDAPPCPKPPPEQPAEVHKAPDVCVTAPTPKVIVKVPEPTVVNMPAACQGPVCQVPAPAMVQQPAMVPQPATVPQPGVVSTALMVGQLAGLGTTTQAISLPRTRITLAFDTIRIPFPILRFIPVTLPGEVTTTTTTQLAQAPPQAQVIAQPAVVQQPTFVQQPAVVAQPAMVQQPVQVVQQPVQVIPQPVQVVQPQPVQPATVECPPVTKQTLDLLQMELDKAKAQLNATQPGSR